MKVRKSDLADVVLGDGSSGSALTDLDTRSLFDLTSRQQ
jgi:hypothetical protein